MTGCAVITDKVTVIVVEGGSKAQKKYAHIVQNRIKWVAEDEEDADEDRSALCIKRECVTLSFKVGGGVREGGSILSITI